MSHKELRLTGLLLYLSFHFLINTIFHPLITVKLVPRPHTPLYNTLFRPQQQTTLVHHHHHIQQQTILVLHQTTQHHLTTNSLYNYPLFRLLFEIKITKIVKNPFNSLCILSVLKSYLGTNFIFMEGREQRR